MRHHTRFSIKSARRLAGRTRQAAEIEKFNVDHAEALEMNAAFDKALADRIDSDHEIALLMN